jgi:hypothetical protein
VWIFGDRKVEIARDIKLVEPNNPNNDGTSHYPSCPSIDPAPESELEIERQMADVPLILPASKVDCDDIEGGQPDADEIRPELKRGSGRPRKVMTGNRGRPRKEYNLVELAGSVEEAFLAEIPLSQAVSGVDADEWYWSMQL